MVADKLSGLGQTIQTEWSLLPEVFQAICNRWHQPQVDLFVIRFNKLVQFVSPVPDPQAWAVDALSLPWEDLDPYAFPPAAILSKVVEKLQGYPCRRIILIAPGRSNMPNRSAIAEKLENSPINVSKGENLNRVLDSFHRQTQRTEGNPILEPLPCFAPADKGSI